jgi:hypothetical protein
LWCYAGGAASLRPRPAVGAGIAHWLGRGRNAREADGPGESGDDIGEAGGGTGADTGADTGGDAGGGTARPDAAAVSTGSTSGDPVWVGGSTVVDAEAACKVIGTEWAAAGTGVGNGLVGSFALERTPVLCWQTE